MKKVKKIKHYKYKKNKKGWMVINCKTDKHTHVRSEYGCYLLIKFLLEGIYPDNPYLQVSYERLEDNKEKKQRYRNIQRGASRC